MVFLTAAVIAIPMFRKLGLGAVLGYLCAGMIIGPQLLGLISDVDNILHVAELGVVLLLFVIGLELQPSRLWALRRVVFGLGGAQIMVTSLALYSLALAFGLPSMAAVVVGLSLSMSSTALALQLLAEKKQLNTHHGHSAFAILLFQDLAAIPMLAIFALLGSSDSSQGWDWLGLGKAIAVIVGVIVGGRWLLRPYLRRAASTDNHEVFIAATLLVVMGTAMLMQQVGLSMALGSFLAGVLLADSEYRHELEADIEPFKGLLLGLFFIAVGMSTDLRLMVQQPLIIIGLAVGLMTIKSCVLYVIARMTRHQHNAAINLALHISQGGEFAFVLFGVAVGAHVLDKALADKLIVVVTLSMVLTPLISIANDKWFKLGQKKGEVRPYDEIENRESRVIIAGLGRFGQMIGRILLLKKIPITVLDSSFLQVETAAKFGYQAYFGDASRLDLLRAARADQAEVFVLAIDDVEASVKAAEMVRKHYPHLKIYARARDRVHAYRLMDVGVDKLIRETFLSSLDLARDVLVELGHTQAKAEAAVRMFRKHDDELLVSQHRIHQDEAKIIASSKQGMDELQRLFEQDAGR